MSRRPVRIFHSQRPFPFIGLSLSLWGSYEFYKISQSTHPVFTPYINKLRKMAGYDAPEESGKREGRREDAVGLMERGDAEARRVREREAGKKAKEDVGEDDGSWMMVNGVPIPSFELLIRPFRRD